MERLNGKAAIKELIYAFHDKYNIKRYDSIKKLNLIISQLMYNINFIN